MEFKLRYVLIRTTELILYESAQRLKFIDTIDNLSNLNKWVLGVLQHNPLFAASLM